MSKTPRGDFALPAKKAFPLNTPGRVAAAPGLASYSEAKGNITPAQAATVKVKAHERAAPPKRPAPAPLAKHEGNMSRAEFDAVKQRKG